MKPDVKNNPSPRSTSVQVPGLADCSLAGGVKSTSKVGTSPPPIPDSDNFDVTVNNLPEKLGFTPLLQEQLASVGGNVHSLTVKLINLFNLDDSGKLWQGRFVSNLRNWSFTQKLWMQVLW